MSVAGYSPDWARLRTAAVYWAPQDLATSRLLSICKALVAQLSGPGTLLPWWVSWTHCVSPGIGYTTLNYSFLLNHSLLWNIANFGLMQLFWDTKKISFINSILFLFAIRFGTSADYRLVCWLAEQEPHRVIQRGISSDDSLLLSPEQ